MDDQDAKAGYLQKIIAEKRLSEELQAELPMNASGFWSKRKLDT